MLAARLCTSRLSLRSSAISMYSPRIILAANLCGAGGKPSSERTACQPHPWPRRLSCSQPRREQTTASHSPHLKTKAGRRHNHVRPNQAPPGATPKRSAIIKMAAFPELLPPARGRPRAPRPSELAQPTSYECLRQIHLPPSFGLSHGGDLLSPAR